jgi:hypothetical protein
LEQFDNVTLNPADPNFIAQKIGDSHPVIDVNGKIYVSGDFASNSNNVYIQMGLGYQAFPNVVLPYGFAPLSPSINKTTTVTNISAPAYITTRYNTIVGSSGSVANNRLYYGFNFSDESSVSWLRGLPSGSAAQLGFYPSGSNVVPLGGIDPGFDLLTLLSGSDATDISGTLPVFRRFSVPFQGGFDGLNPAVIRATGPNVVSTNLMGFDLSSNTSAGSIAYNTAIQLLADKDSYDINLLVMPGVLNSLHGYVVSQGITMVENRGDVFYVIDGDVYGATEQSIVTNVSGLTTNYGATYHPWVKIPDVVSNKTIWVPPSVVMPAVYAFNDRVGAEWFAPAGLRRGGIPNALQVRTRLDQAGKDLLYDNRVNPIAIFPREGITVWGQKTLQRPASALDRINVRRLLIALKKFIASTARYLVFEQNTTSTRNQFLSIVNPYLASVQQRQGLYAFKVVMDDSNNSPADIDRNILRGDIFLQPAKAVEFIVLTFNVLPTGLLVTGG